ncbi:expressed protein [Echinococcus multilocularis]|uniref:Expressed protein n=1 Tax=Echinococcus multilocularis TaxID=6211 RepID=A0A087W2E4_ECHMU|nr:expressed protein [Echinococcus multilocularis]
MRMVLGYTFVRIENAHGVNSLCTVSSKHGIRKRKVDCILHRKGVSTSCRYFPKNTIQEIATGKQRFHRFNH